MAFNVPTVTAARITAGPGRMFLGASGATPSVDVGAIADEGVTIELTAEIGEVRQGNASLPVLRYARQHDARFVCTGLEWDFDALQYAMGSGITTVSGSAETYGFGGDPVVDTVAVHVQHQMLNGDTLNAYMWAGDADPGVSIALSADPHGRQLAFKARRSTTTWGGAALASGEELVRVEQVL